MVLMTVQVLGQLVIRWDLSIAQLLVSLGTAAAVELAVTVPRTRVVAWPASALLTGNGVALLLRIPGTEHGDWWSMRGWYVVAATSAISVASKYVIRVGGRPLFNPSNLGLVVALLAVGSSVADPQDLWWGRFGPGLAFTYAWILAGGLVITSRLGLLRISALFWSVFAALIGLLALLGHSMTARWSLGPVEGWQYWNAVAGSPEVLIFLFFMITDPRTVPVQRRAYGVYAVAVAVTSAVLIAFQSTEFAVKVALLGGLVVVCGARPLIERWVGDGPERRMPLRRIAVLAGPAIVAVGVAGAVVSASNDASISDGSVGDGSVGDGSSTGRADLAAIERLDDSLRPDVSMGDGFATVGSPFAMDDARRVANGTVAAVLLSDEAIADDDGDAARQVAAGEFLEEVLAAPARPAPSRTVTSAVVDIVRDPDEFQAQPRLLVVLTGTEDGRDWETGFHVLATTADVRIEREVSVEG